MVSDSEQVLQAILATVGRQTFPPQTLGEIVGTSKQIAAYNMCDGSKSQAEVAKSLKLDSGNFSSRLLKNFGGSGFETNAKLWPACA
jgi:hypothetical protein